MTDFCKAQVTGTVSTGPTFQATGKKYVVASDGDSSFKLIAVDADMANVSVGDVVRCIGKFRLHSTTAIVDSTANAPYSGLSFGELPSNTEKGTLLQNGTSELTGKVVTALTAFAAGYKYVEMEYDTDPGEAKIKVKHVVPDYWGTGSYPNPQLNTTFALGPVSGYYVEKISDGYYFSPWTMGQHH